MFDISQIDYSILDQPEILMFLFHPRPEWGERGPQDGAQDFLIPVEEDVAVGARLHVSGKDAPFILFFHGNGEIVGDYDEMGPLYNQLDINFMAADYRGYGRSTGRPTVTSMMRDCHLIFDFTTKWMQDNGFSGPLILMGRSLGSASALELAARYKSEIDGLIVESGFAYAGPLLTLLGVNLRAMGFKEEAGFGNVDKISQFPRPTLIIHAEMDHIIPFSDGQALYDASRAEDKRLLRIPGANHNNIFMLGLTQYMQEIKALAERVIARTPSR